jgi:hypothetical protein
VNLTIPKDRPEAQPKDPTIGTLPLQIETGSAYARGGAYPFQGASFLISNQARDSTVVLTTGTGRLSLRQKITTVTM